MDTKSAKILGACIIVAALAVSLLPWLTTGSPGAVCRIHSAGGSLAVHYMVHTSPTSAEGSRMHGVSDIEFYPTYVVVKTKNGSGSVFFAERTQKLEWSLTKR